MRDNLQGERVHVSILTGHTVWVAVLGHVIGLEAIRAVCVIGLATCQIQELDGSGGEKEWEKEREREKEKEINGGGRERRGRVVRICILI